VLLEVVDGVPVLDVTVGGELLDGGGTTLGETEREVPGLGLGLLLVLTGGGPALEGGGTTALEVLLLAGAVEVGAEAAEGGSEPDGLGVVMLD